MELKISLLAKLVRTNTKHQNIQQFCPSNVMLRYTKIRDEISQTEVLKRFDKAIIELKDKWANMPTEELNMQLAKSNRNYKSDLGVTPSKEILLNSALVHDAFIYSEWDFDTKWAFREDMLPIGFCYTGKWGLHLKSSPSSTVQFWVGYGILEKTQSAYIPKILTYKQFLKIQDKLVTESANFASSILPSGIGTTTL